MVIVVIVDIADVLLNKHGAYKKFTKSSYCFETQKDVKQNVYL